MEIEKNIKKLNEMILQGKAMDAFEQFYADDIVMQENDNEPVNGKDANRKREIEFFSMVEKFNGAEVKALAVNGNISMVEWSMDITFKKGGRKKMNQVAVQKWKDGKIISERFYYNAG